LNLDHLEPAVASGLGRATVPIGCGRRLGRGRRDQRAVDPPAPSIPVREFDVHPGAIAADFHDLMAAIQLEDRLGAEARPGAHIDVAGRDTQRVALRSKSDGREGEGGDEAGGSKPV
jgi:hypothetical protein